MTSRMSIRIEGTTSNGGSKIIEVLKEEGQIYTFAPINQHTLDLIIALERELEFAPKDRHYDSVTK